MSVRSCSVKSFDTSSPRRLWPRIRLASGDAEQKAAANTSVEGRETLTLKGHSWVVSSVSFSPDGKRIVSGGGVYNYPGEIKVWDAATGQETLTLKGHSGFVKSVSFSPDGKRIVSGSCDDTVKVWDAQTDQETLSLLDTSE